MQKKNWKKIGIGAAFATCVFLMAGSAFAIGFGDIGVNVGNNSEGMAVGLKKGAFLLGLFFVVAALGTFATMSKTNVQAKIPAIMLSVGVCLLALQAFISTGSETIFGTDETSSSQGILSLDQ